ncbi:MAG: hypothetical protein DI570_07995 [Phenylobacterium zucineum]|nr:MAG: hypothetical protein DI570_07995 [Phenylobacterium zucineum]
MTEIHPFLFLVIAEFAVFMSVLAGAALWTAAGAAKPKRAAHAVVRAKSPTSVSSPTAHA